MGPWPDVEEGFERDFSKLRVGAVKLPAVIQVTEARLVNPLTSTSLTSRARDISALGRYNQKCDVVENKCL